VCIRSFSYSREEKRRPDKGKEGYFHPCEIEKEGRRESGGEREGGREEREREREREREARGRRRRRFLETASIFKLTRSCAGARRGG